MGNCPDGCIIPLGNRASPEHLHNPTQNSGSPIRQHPGVLSTSRGGVVGSLPFIPRPTDPPWEGRRVALSGSAAPQARQGGSLTARGARQARMPLSGSTRRRACGSRLSWRARTCCGSGPAPAWC